MLLAGFKSCTRALVIIQDLFSCVSLSGYLLRAHKCVEYFNVNESSENFRKIQNLKRINEEICLEQQLL